MQLWMMFWSSKLMVIPHILDNRLPERVHISPRKAGLARHRAAIVGARLVMVDGVVERQDYGAAPIIHIRAKRVEDRSDLLATLHVRGEGGAVWDRALARADEVKTPQRDARAPRGHPRDQARFIPGSRDFR
jgi:error-prone DNA polymerase